MYAIVAGIALLSFAAHAAELRLADAAQAALTQNPDILVQRAQVDVMRGQEAEAKGQFDWNLSSNVNYNRTITPMTNSAAAMLGTGAPDQIRQTTTGYTAGLTRQLENGMTIGTNVVASGTNSDASGVAPWQQNLTTLNVTLAVPLLRGRDTDSVTAAEQAARLNLLASRYAMRDQVAQTLYNTLLAYWSYRSTVDLEKVAIDNEVRSRDLLASVQKLVDASERPTADLVLIKADLADKVVAHQAATLARINAKTALGRILGLDAGAILQLPDPADPLPESDQIPSFNVTQIQDLAQAALLQRPDQRVLALQMQAQEKLVHAASDNLKPQLDFQTGLGYSKASEGGSHFGFITEPGRYQSGPSVYAQLVFQFPLQNNVAKGTVVERSATLTQMSIKQRDLATGIASDVENAVQTLKNNAEQLRVARDGLALYEKAVQQEITKQKSGISTLIDVITVQDRYVSARANFLQLQLAYASAAAKLRFATGTLLPPIGSNDEEADQFSIDVNALSGLGPLAHPNGVR